MVTSVIRHRVADFLKQHAPFDSLSSEDLLALAGSGKVKFHESEEYVYWRGDKKGKFLWVIQQGRVEVWDEGSTPPVLKDVLGEGDVPAWELLVNEPCRYAVKTATDVILYGIAVEQFEAMVARYGVLQQFLTAHVRIAGLGQRVSWLATELPPLEYLQARVAVLPAGAAAWEAAQQLAHSRGEMVALLDAEGVAVGTVGPRELLRDPSGPALAVARTQVPSLGTGAGVREAIREMLRHRGDHVALTECGQAGGKLAAVLTASELSLFCGHDPVRLIQALREADSVVQLTPLLRQTIRSVREGVAEPSDVDDCCEISVAMMKALCEACIRQAQDELEREGMSAPKVPVAWVLFGASARGDSLEPTLPALAVLYDGEAAEAQGEAAPAAMYFAALVGRALSRLHACGLPVSGWEWPEGAQPSMPLVEWRRLYRETIENPLAHDLFARREFFDCQFLGGEASLLEGLQAEVRQYLAAGEGALALLANDTLAQMPPLTFFRGMVLDLEGSPQQRFAVGESMLAPLVNAARVFALACGRLGEVGSKERLASAMVDYPEAASTIREAMDAFRIGLYYQCVSGSNDLDPATLNKFDQLLLKTAFAAIHRFLEFTVRTFVPSA